MEKRQKWETLESTVLHYSRGTPHNTVSKKIVMFDMDKTLIRPASGAKFPKHNSDWKWLNECVLERLVGLVSDPTTRVIVISNQGWRSGRDMRLARARAIVESWISTLFDACSGSVSKVDVFLLTGKDRYRKPFPGIFDLLGFSSLNGLKTKMIYVGDSAGRPKDHSDADIKFAYNAQIYLGRKIAFKTPEQFFLGSEVKLPALDELQGFNPRVFMEQFKGKKPSALRSEMFEGLRPLDEQEVILLVGPPGIGKSSFAQSLVKSFSGKSKKQYQIVSQDDYASGGARRAVKRLGELLETGYSVIVDNTHPDAAMRRRYIMAAEKYFESVAGSDGAIRAFILGADMEMPERIALAKHLDALRVVSGRASRVLPEVAYRTFNSRWVMPTASEGFCAIEKIKFVPCFRSIQDLKWFMMRF